MTYNVFGGTLNLAQSQSYRYNRRQIWCFNYGNVKKTYVYRRILYDVHVTNILFFFEHLLLQLRLLYCHNSKCL